MKKTLIIYLFFITSSFADINNYKNLNSLNYDLYRNDELIGFHNYNFKRENDKLTVKSDVKFEIVKLGVTLYKYKASSEEIYKKGNFQKFSAKTNQNKKLKFANIIFDKTNDQLIIDGSSYKGPASKNFVVGTWWNHNITKSKAQISAVSGRIIEQKVTFLGKKDIKLDGKNFTALHYNFSSSNENLSKEKKLNTDIWYDANTKIWLKASFNKMGLWEYRLKSNK